MAARHAEIAGAGLSGLMAATRLAQLGWSVRLHERGSELRMFGAGIWLWENGLRSLEAAGALDAAVARAQVIKEWRVADEHGRTLFSRPMTADDRLLLPPRADLYEALIQRAEKLGVDIVTSSTAVAASPDGVLELESGRQHRADLVIVADGAFSRLREGLLCTASIDYGIEAGIRMLIDRSAGYPDDVCTEYWNDRWRLLYNPCTDGQDYIFLSAPVSDERARRMPIDRELWREKFPVVADVIERFTEASRWDRLVNVRCRAWSAGSVADHRRRCPRDAAESGPGREHGLHERHVPGGRGHHGRGHPACLAGLGEARAPADRPRPAVLLLLRLLSWTLAGQPACPAGRRTPGPAVERVVRAGAEPRCPAHPSGRERQRLSPPPGR